MLIEVLRKNFDEKTAITLSAYLEATRNQNPTQSVIIGFPREHAHTINHPSFVSMTLTLVFQTLSNIVEDWSRTVARFNAGVYGIGVGLEAVLCVSVAPWSFFVVVAIIFLWKIVQKSA